MDKVQLVDAAAQACLLFYRTQGLGAAAHCLKTMLSSLVAIKRVNIIYVSRAFDACSRQHADQFYGCIQKLGDAGQGA